MQNANPVPSFEGIGHAIQDKWLQVPTYQRSYAWDDDHVEALLGDIANAIADNEPEYFLGSIIVTPGQDGRIEVVDGQQRLATTSILIASIRDYIWRYEDKERALEVQRRYLTSRDEYTMAYVPRLRLNSEDSQFFEDFILPPPDDPRRKRRPTKRSHRRIEAAAQLCQTKVHALAESHGNNALRLMGWVKYLCESAKIICFSVSDHANAYVIFETLNDRGLDLSQADLLKNYLFSIAGRDKLGVVQQCWAEMKGALESQGGKDDHTANYIRYLWISRNGPARDRGLYKRIKGKIKGVDAAVDLATQLSENAVFYAAILSPQHPHWEPYGDASRDYIDALQILGVKRIRPVLLSVLARFSVPEAKKAIRLMVSWSVRFLIAGGPAGTVEDQLGVIAKDIFDKKHTTAAAMMAALEKKIVPTDQEFQTKFETATVSDPGLARYYLRALENWYAEEDEPAKVVNLRKDVVNVEHVMPEKPSEEWTLDDDIMDAYNHRIGNLALMRMKLNSQAGNAGFAKKVEFYKQENSLQLTKALAENTEWGPIQIESRQKLLAEYAVKTWPIKP